VGSAQGPAEELTVELERATPVNGASLMEDLSAGEAVREWRLLARVHGRWQGVAVGTAIGHRHLTSFATVVADAVKLEVRRADEGHALRSVEVMYC
ncbi:MAG: hypothetical protein ACOCZ7_03265, partial [Armatimonadota bacterium]